jgi:hypothetical protein
MCSEKSGRTLPIEMIVPEHLPGDDLPAEERALHVVDDVPGLADLDSSLRELLRFTGDNPAVFHARHHYTPMPGDSRAALLLKVLNAAADPLMPPADKRRLVNFCGEALPRYFVRQRLALPRTPGPSAKFTSRERRALREAYDQLLALFQKRKRVARTTVADIVARCLPDREAAILQRARTLQDQPAAKAYLRAREALAYVCEVSPDLIAKRVAEPRRPRGRAG